MKITTLQITLDVVHGDEIDPVHVAHHTADVAHGQVTKTKGDEVGIVSSTILETRNYEGRGARDYDACDCADCKALDAAAADAADDDDKQRASAMKVTALQITLDVVHRDEADPTDVALDVADTAHDAVTWTMWPELAAAIDRAHRIGGDGVGVVSSTALGTRDYEGTGARAYDNNDDDDDVENVVDSETVDSLS
jgi:hypothetical protein